MNWREWSKAMNLTRSFLGQLLLAIGMIFGALSLMVVPVAIGMVRSVGWAAAWVELAPRLKLVVLVMGGFGAVLGGLALVGRAVRVAHERLVPNRYRRAFGNAIGSVVLAGLLGVFVVAMYRSGVRQGIGLKEAQSRHAAEGAHGLAADFENQSERLQALESESEHLLQSLDRTGDMLEAARRDVRQVATAARDQLSAVDSAHASIGGLVAREQALSEQAAALQRILGGRSPVVREDLERMNRASLVTGFIAGVMSSIVAAGILGGFRSASSRIASLLRRRVG